MGAFVLSTINLIKTGSADLPAWAVALTASVSTFFFASKGTEVATENHVNMTDRLFNAEQNIIAHAARAEKVYQSLGSDAPLLTRKPDTPDV